MGNQLTSSPPTLQRALGAIASLGCTDLLSQERVLLLTRPRLQELSAGSPGPVTNKATKVGSLQGPEEGVQDTPAVPRPPPPPLPSLDTRPPAPAAGTSHALRTAGGGLASSHTQDPQVSPTFPGFPRPSQQICLLGSAFFVEAVSSRKPSSCRKPSLTAWMAVFLYSVSWV